MAPDFAGNELAWRAQPVYSLAPPVGNPACPPPICPGAPLSAGGGAGVGVATTGAEVAAPGAEEGSGAGIDTVGAGAGTFEAAAASDAAGAAVSSLLLLHAAMVIVPRRRATTIGLFTITSFFAIGNG